MKVEEIPSDTLVKMTKFWHKAFNVVGCDPQCHCCGKMIPPNNQFKLSTVLADKGRFWGDGLELQKKVLQGEVKPDRKIVMKVHVLIRISSYYFYYRTFKLCKFIVVNCA